MLEVDLCGVVNLSFSAALNKANYDSYSDLALNFNLPIHYCENVNNPVTLNWIREKEPDIIIQSGWSQKFGNELLLLPKYGCIGEHPAPLPRGRGAACVNWAILTGETKWGDTFFKMVERYDEGEIYAQKLFDITMYDDVSTVYDKIALSSSTIIKENIVDWTSGFFNEIVQDESKATYYGKRKPEDGEFEFNLGALELYNFMRAQTKPYPGAFFMYNGQKVIVWSAERTKEKTKLAPGEFLPSDKDGGVYVAVKNGELLKLLRVQEENQPEQWAMDVLL
ncbi:MAG: methionyl-tRNA formyltransferase [Lactobacillales bacterium]|nr:methionyl-tRNA formyltransferase [Lactobacillales bacterium]